MKSIKWIFIGLSFFFMACEELASDIDVKEGESKLVLNAYLTPNDSIIKIQVTQTQPLIGAGIDPIVRNAVLIITDGLQTDTIPYSPDEMLYAINKRVRGGTTYTVRATLPDGRWAEASCTTPQDLPLDYTYTIDSTMEGNKIEYTVTMNWQDLSAATNVYYRTDAEMYYILIDTLTQEFQFITKELTSTSSEIIKSTGTNANMQIIYKSDKEARYVEKFLELHLLMVDEDYYQFEKAKKNNYSGFPNYEYTKLYSNVKNGFGIVASYNNYVIKPLNVN